MAQIDKGLLKWQRQMEELEKSGTGQDAHRRTCRFTRHSKKQILVHSQSDRNNKKPSECHYNKLHLHNKALRSSP